MGGDRPQTLRSTLIARNRDDLGAHHAAPRGSRSASKAIKRRPNVRMMCSNTLVQHNYQQITAPTTLTENASIRALHPPHSKNKKGLARDRAFFVPANSAVERNIVGQAVYSWPRDFPRARVRLRAMCSRLTRV